MGVYDPELVEKFPLVLRKLGVKRALVAHGEPGIDEISTAGETYVGELKEGEISHYRIHPEDFGLPEVNPEAIGDLAPEESARLAIEILNGKAKGPARDVVLLNSAAGIYVAGGADSIEEGIEMAEKAINSGKAYQTLKNLVEATGDPEELTRLEEKLFGEKQ